MVASFVDYIWATAPLLLLIKDLIEKIIKGEPFNMNRLNLLINGFFKQLNIGLLSG